MTITEANAVNTLLYWLRAQPNGGGVLPGDRDALEAARTLAAKANKVLMAGIRPEQLTEETWPTVEVRQRL